MRPEDPSRPDEGGTERLLMLATLAEVEPAFLEECVGYGTIRLEELSESRAELAPSQLARLRRLHRICRSLELDAFAGCIIVDLLDRMDGLQRQLERLRAAAEEPPTDL